jgi:hypothetical protein
VILNNDSDIFGMRCGVEGKWLQAFQIL